MAGSTWAGTPAANPARRVQGDDVIVFGRDGTAFHTYIAFDGIRVDRPEVAATGIWMRRTRDGVTWDPPVRVVDHVNTVMPFEDKPWTAVDRAAGSPHRGNVYVAWTRFDVYGSADPSHRSTIWFARSRDGGRVVPAAVRGFRTTPATRRTATARSRAPCPRLARRARSTWCGPGPKGCRSIDPTMAGGRSAPTSSIGR